MSNMNNFSIGIEFTELFFKRQNAFIEYLLFPNCLIPLQPNDVRNKNSMPCDNGMTQ
jgi:hypothetical protein